MLSSGKQKKAFPHVSTGSPFLCDQGGRRLSPIPTWLFQPIPKNNPDKRNTTMSFKKTDVNYVVGKEYPFTVAAVHDDFSELHDESNFSVYPP